MYEKNSNSEGNPQIVVDYQSYEVCDKSQMLDRKLTDDSEASWKFQIRLAKTNFVIPFQRQFDRL